VFIIVAEGLVVSLKDLWQQQREQRQQEIVRRQQSVSQHQQQVREHLSYLNQQRLAETQQLQLSLNAFQLDLQQQTQDYLKMLSSQRHQQAQALAISLQTFAQNLHVATQQFLSATSADRYLRADALFRELNQFHTMLSSGVAKLRGQMLDEIQQLRETVQTICAETQMYLSSRQQERLQEQLELANTLATYVQQLQANVGSYLGQLNQLDQERATTLNREFQEHRQQRADSMNALFEELGVFRGELRTYCQDLHAMVWGGESSAAASVSPLRAKPAVSTPAARVPSYRPSTIQAPPRPAAQPSSIPAPTSTPSPNFSTPRSSQPSASSTPPSSATAVATPVKTEAPVDSAEPAQTEPDPINAPPSAAMTWNEVPTTAPPVRGDISEVEGEIFSYLEAVEGARLIEIEHALDINRFQTVDALRSLIKQGRVIQRDRVYVVQDK
jgi:hypothetical protein